MLFPPKALPVLSGQIRGESMGTFGFSEGCLCSLPVQIIGQAGTGYRACPEQLRGLIGVGLSDFLGVCVATSAHIHPIVDFQRTLTSHSIRCSQASPRAIEFFDAPSWIGCQEISQMAGLHLVGSFERETSGFASL
jgi:hypothetical protein